ncbi:substrate-binding periplasmic protein [Kaarinaea lacus]
MKNLFFDYRASLMIVLFLMMPLVAAADLKLVADNWPPFSSEKQGQRIAVELVEQALLRSGVKAKTDIIQWKQVLEGIKANKYDAIVGAWKDSEREQYLLFSRPYLENRIMLVGRVDNKIDFNGLSQLANKKIAVVEGYAYGNAISNNKKIIRVKGATVAENIKKLLRKEVDFILADSIVAQAMKQYLPEDVKSQLTVYDQVVVTHSLHFAVRKNHPEATMLLKKFNKAIGEMIADGSYNKILGFDWVVADTNSDGINEYIVGSQLRSKTLDPAATDSSYSLFSTEQNMGKKPVLKYRVLNQEYNSWSEAQQAINEAQEIGVSPHEDTSGTFDFLIGKF